MNQTNLFKEYKGVFEKETPTHEAVGGPTKSVGRVFGYSPFALQDAIGEKSAKKAWIEYQKLRLAGIEAEELIHKIVSKVRDMAAISMGANKEDLGIQKDYPYNKSKRDAKNWKEEDLKKFYTKLVEIYHLSRMESGNQLDIALEKTILFL
jgi:DNA polymerase III gamma/tau subunit